ERSGAGGAGLGRARAAAGGGEAVDGVTLLAPTRPAKMLCSGINYASHGEEAKAANLHVPEEPFFFSKLPSAIIGHGEPIRIPREETQADYEVELALVIGKRGYRLSEED